MIGPPTAASDLRHRPVGEGAFEGRSDLFSFLLKISSMMSAPVVITGPQFPAVSNLGCPGGGTADEPGDLLHADAAVAHQAHE